MNGGNKVNGMSFAPFFVPWERRLQKKYKVLPQNRRLGEHCDHEAQGVHWAYVEQELFLDGWSQVQHVCQVEALFWRSRCRKTKKEEQSEEQEDCGVENFVFMLSNEVCGGDGRKQRADGMMAMVSIIVVKPVRLVASEF